MKGDWSSSERPKQTLKGQPCQKDFVFLFVCSHLAGYPLDLQVHVMGTYSSLGLGILSRFEHLLLAAAIIRTSRFLRLH